MLQRLVYISVAYVLLLQACVPIPPHSASIATPELNKQASSSDADAYFQEKHYQEAIAIYETLLSQQADNLDVAFKLAESYRLNGDTEKSIMLYQKTLKADPQAFHAKEGMGLALLQQQKLNEAMQVFLDLLKQDATRWRTINALGVTYNLQGKAVEAKEYYDMALAIAPQNPSIFNNMGLSYVLTQENIPYGIELLKEGLALAKTEQAKQQITLNLALAHGIAGNDEQATEILSPLLSQAAIYNNLGIYASLRNDKALAKTYLSKALTSEPVFYEKASKNLDRIEKEQR